MSSIAAMVMSIKNNKRARQSAFKKLDKNGSYSTKTKLFFQKNASKKQLRDIKEKLRKENKKALIRKTAIILILLIILIYCIGFAKF
ncbi:MAG: hypothetical protein HOL35_05505 [Flavobacterium sp.]|jgi:hypothetical protein|nr:hypothetical protein [Flavobacterium sp.]MDB2556051.1 hypothetical protein [Flavobacteriaceae bacterium]MDG2275050.1 hypothetical protein [Flavobacteriaceae bacterium]|tara:strand:+ start:166 stop:426 length:261 start_codon:yes stop_codon:yes gene_type:complete